MQRYRVVCNKEKEFLKDGCTLDQIYGGMAYRDLTKEQAETTAQQMNEWKVAGEKYKIQKEDLECN